MEKDNKTTEAYNKIADDYNKRNNKHFWINEYAYYKSILPGNKVVDLGCGAGRDGEQFVRDGFDYLGVDLSEGMLKIAQDRVAEGQFSLLHFPKTEVPTILKSFYNLLKSNGVGFISVKDKKIMDEGFIKEEKFGGIERYFSFFTENEMTSFLEKANFKIIKIVHCFEGDDLDTEWLCFFVKK
jgi:SAM-dependent methyltransferase